MPDRLCRRRPSSVAEWSDLPVPDAVSTLVTKEHRTSTWRQTGSEVPHAFLDAPPAPPTHSFMTGIRVR
jgi:hypothetical protein